jgi:hypothetical protein
MPTQTYTPIARNTLSSNQTDVSFTSIPSTYTDIVCVLSCAGSANNLQVSMRFNNTTVTYSVTELYGRGTTAGSYRSPASGISLSPDVALENVVGKSNYIVNIMNYANTTTNKTVLTRTNAIGSGFPGTAVTVGMWADTAAINRIDFIGAFLSGSTFTLYGIKAGS